MQPTIRYAKSGNIHVAYHVFGQGAVDLVFVPGFISHLENWWSEPTHARWLHRLGESARVIMFDKRGTGLSDRVIQLPDMDDRMDDVRAVMDAVGIERAAVMGVSEAGSLASLVRRHAPRALSGARPLRRLRAFLLVVPDRCGIAAVLSTMPIPPGAREPACRLFVADNGRTTKRFQEWWVRFERLGATPAACIDIMQLNSQIDVSAILPTIHVPTLVIHRHGRRDRQCRRGPGTRGAHSECALCRAAWYGPRSVGRRQRRRDSSMLIEEFLTGSTSSAGRRSTGCLQPSCLPTSSDPTDKAGRAWRPPLARPVGCA